MTTGHTIKTTLHAMVDAIEDLTIFSPQEITFLNAYHAALNAGATTLAYDSYFFNYILRKITLQHDNY